MSLEQIALTTNKSISNVGDFVRKIGQGERGQVLPVLVTDANGSPYDLTNKKLVFSENKDSGKYVVDDGQAPESGNFELTDAKSGKFNYTLQEQIYSVSGTAWFDIVSQDGNVLDTTNTFKFIVIPSINFCAPDDNYLSTIHALQAHYQAVIAKNETDTQQLIENLNDKITQAISDGNKSVADEVSSIKEIIQQMQTEYKSKSDALAKLTSDWQTQTQTIQNNADDQLKQINENANSEIDKLKQDVDSQLKTNQENATAALTKINQDAADQLKSNQTANDAEINSVKQQLSDELAKVETDKATAIQGITNARDKAISDATDKLNAKLTALQQDYDEWKTSTVGDFQTKLDKLTEQLNTDETDQASLRQAIDSAKETVSKLHEVDFTVYAHKTDLENYYTKAETDDKLAEAGKVKTVNGIQPDSAGNITIPAPDLSDLETKADAKTANDTLDKKISDNTVAIRKNSDAIATKANASDVYTKAELDPKLADAGKVKTVNNIEPVDGNITIPAPDLSGLETKADAKKALDAKADKTDLDSKADKTDVTTLQATVTGLSTKVDSVVTKLSDGTLAKVAHFKASEEQKAVDWSKDDGKGGLPKIGIIDG